MKKLFALVLSVLLLVVMTGCDDSKQKTDPGETVETTYGQQQTPSTGDPQQEDGKQSESQKADPGYFKYFYFDLK